MTQAINMPRVEIVGSFLPPEELENALNEKIRGNLSDADYHAVEDRVIDRLIDREIEAGLSCDRRRNAPQKLGPRLREGFEGMSRKRIDTGNIYQDDILRHDLLRFSGKIEFNPAHPFFDKFVHMQELTAGRAEVRRTIPSPGQLYMRMFLSSNGDPGKFYATPDTLIDDIVEAYSRTIAEFYRLGCRHIQLDTEVRGRLSSPEFDRMLLLGGADVNEITRLLLDLINRSIATRPADLEITFNIAANEQAVPRWYDEKELANLRLMLETIDADAFLLPFEISSPEAINALRWLPAGKRVILGAG